MTTIESRQANDCRTNDELLKTRLAQLIHQLAQPLTMLTGILDLCSEGDEMTQQEFQMRIEQAKEQVARVNDGFNKIRNAAHSHAD
jgi:hypothetical protein